MAVKLETVSEVTSTTISLSPIERIPSLSGVPSLVLFIRTTFTSSSIAESVTICVPAKTVVFTTSSANALFISVATVGNWS